MHYAFRLLRRIALVITTRKVATMTPIEYVLIIRLSHRIRQLDIASWTHLYEALTKAAIFTASMTGQNSLLQNYFGMSIKSLCKSYMNKELKIVIFYYNLVSFRHVA